MRIAALTITLMVLSTLAAMAQISAPPVPGPSGVAPPPQVTPAPAAPPPAMTVPKTPGAAGTPGTAGAGASRLPGDNPSAPGFPKTSR